VKTSELAPQAVGCGPAPKFISVALSEGLAIVTTTPGDVPASVAPYLLGVRVTRSGEKFLARRA
jgi:hypothetical protein